MNESSIIRKVDDLGRIVIPTEIRQLLDIHTKDPLEIVIDNDKIVLQKHRSDMECHVTGNISPDNLSLHDGKLVLSTEGAKLIITELKQSLMSIK
ncbi:AbrB/MazE/SpoVT family DNA-binding domain-containing protein [Alkalihalobacillus pseudalcaliphilus]|uniref:AbrB/MazE/SpoVT family DNA-binding domain-containing protein n=1 Tax=Alkalihalobacillus pseudalcaliphilus TaxID=79884 RepID=UPI00064DF96F|nr:AbrB/MazE/SpoVT family DNA-binding domain-containing protein [Alkalihalobacillus pseudalcaliphilus]KMK76717.1 hypothetical protein AB990_15325 [Alkalihalobacillus pseudalcaliphilus]